MVKNLTRMTRPVCISLLAAGLSGCAGFIRSIDDEQIHCPVVNIPDNRQPFDTAARKQLQQMIDRNNNHNENTSKTTALVRLDERGIPLTHQQTIHDRELQVKNDSTVPWACVRDDRTGLTWEVKTNDRSLRDTRWTYTWYEPSRTGKNGYAGKANGGKCRAGNTCDTQAYVAAINTEKLCGHDDWRLPQAFELHTILDHKNNCPGTCTDQDYFPDTASGGYWSSSPFDECMCYAWGVDFRLGTASGAYKDTPLHIRLVRGKQLITSSGMKSK